MSRLERLCVYCGSKTGASEDFANLARLLGRRCADRAVGIVYGGGGIGLMGILATAARAAGGQVTGVMPSHLSDRELAHTDLDELVIVDSMHTRKREMAERADAFCVLPGGLGSLDEAVEIITWKQLGLHDKPIVLLDHAGFWQPFLQLLAHQTRHGFLHAEHGALFDVARDVDGVFAAIANHPESTRSLASEQL
jgi:uncharacterized protein (TIGR00730 family)